MIKIIDKLLADELALERKKVLDLTEKDGSDGVRN